MRHQFFPPKGLWQQEVNHALRLQASENTHRRELAALERVMRRRVEAAERLCALVVFEQECLKRQLRGLVTEVEGLRLELRTGVGQLEHRMVSGSLVVTGSSSSSSRNQGEEEEEASRGGLEWVEVIKSPQC